MYEKKDCDNGERGKDSRKTDSQDLMPVDEIITLQVVEDSILEDGPPSAIGNSGSVTIEETAGEVVEETVGDLAPSNVTWGFVTTEVVA